jgi:lipooligosaccharide transport system permease protein
MLASGVFFPLEGLPRLLQLVAQWLPLTHAVAIIRPLMVGRPVLNAPLHALVLLVYSGAAYTLATVLLRRRLLN